jgi:Na+-transporting NADH:ubiquinone oxidoreductase subunit C
MMRKKKWFPVLYMFMVTAFFSSIVIGVSQFTKERVAANKKRSFEQAILASLPGIYDAQASDLELHRRFQERIDQPNEFTAGACTLKEDGRLIAYALPISGQGFWAPIKGVIGIAADKKTITGVVFYEQKETPGLGAQITTSQFRNQFKGKVMSAGPKPLNFRRPGDILGPSDVHAVTGATQTSARLEKIINDGLKKWQLKITQGAN